VGVSYWEAEAFCTWAGGRLPTEREWEAAAHGKEGNEYPWGSKWEDGICNTMETELNVTTAVGLFPRSRSKSYGLEDMAGNVCEWCVDKYYLDKEYRVVRGGSWYIDRVVARADIRSWGQPYGRLSLVGFRAVRTLSPGLK
jgi:formylglycine-generating enzyme required for sulfatase activity